MGWLLSQVITSILGAFVIVTIFDTIFRSVIGPLVSAGKAALFVGTGTAITAGLGMVGVKKAVRTVRQASKEAGERLYPLPDQKRLK